MLLTFASIGRGPDCGWLPGEPATVGPSRLTSDHYFEAELERLIRLQVVAGPRHQTVSGQLTSKSPPPNDPSAATQVAERRADRVPARNWTESQQVRSGCELTGRIEKVR